MERILCRVWKIDGKGMAKRDFIHVEDTCEAITKIVNTKKNLNGNVLNVGSGKCISINSICNKITKIKKYNKNKVQYITDRPGQVDKHICDISKFYKIFKWKPKIKFEDGLNKTFEWYEKNSSWWKNKISMQQIRIVMPDGKVLIH